MLIAIVIKYLEVNTDAKNQVEEIKLTTDNKEIEYDNKNTEMDTITKKFNHIENKTTEINKNNLLNNQYHEYITEINDMKM